MRGVHGHAHGPGTARHGRYPNLDFVRFVAATAVLASHSYTLAGRGGEPAPLGYETLGGLAVAVFFVISGFLVTGAWQRNPSVLAFAWHRALRIMPALVVVVTLSALVLGPLLTPLPLHDYLAHPQTRQYFANLTFTRLNYALPGLFAANPFPHAVNGSLWTLPIEVSMYLVLGILAALGLVRRSVAMGLVMVLGMAWFVGGREWLARATDAFPAVLPPAATLHLALWFFLGSLLWLARIRYRAWLAATLLLLAWLGQGTFAGSLVLHLAIAYFVLWFAQVDLGQLGRFGRRGDFSYGMYLYAFPVQQVVAQCGGAAWPFPAYVVSCFVATLACAVASWHWIEAPMLRLKNRSRAPATTIASPPAGEAPHPGT